MRYRVFFYFRSTGTKSSSSNPREMEAKEVARDLVPRLESEDDYIGFIDDRDNVLQLMYDPGRNSYWVELPLMDQRMSYGKDLNGDELLELILHLPNLFRLKDFPDFWERRW